MIAVDDLTDVPVHWKQKAACAGLSPSDFYPVSIGTRPIPTKKRLQPAMEVCWGFGWPDPHKGPGCPVRHECLEYALSTGEREGVWGGRLLRQGKIVA